MYGAESLDAEGFIHFSRWSQLAGTVSRYYAGVPDLVVLVVDENALDDLRIELSPSTGETFPHLYGELPVSAVIEVLPLEQALERAAGGSAVDVPEVPTTPAARLQRRAL